MKSRMSSVWQPRSRNSPPPACSACRRQGRGVPVLHARHDVAVIRARQAVADARDRSELAGRDQIAGAHEARQRAPVVGDEQRHAGGRERRDHALALGVVARHRLLDVGGLARGAHRQRQAFVRAGRRRDVDGVDRRVGDQRARVVGPGRNAVAARVVGGEIAAPPHDGLQRAALRLLEGGAALHLGDVPAAENPPADRRGRGGRHRRASYGDRGASAHLAGVEADHLLGDLGAWSSTAKWPESRRCISARGRSRR